MLVQGGDDDIDALLAAMKVQDVNKVVIHDDCSPPSARSCACFVAHTTKVTAVRYQSGALQMAHWPPACHAATCQLAAPWTGQHA
jgi:hypothetical protein